VSPWQEDELRAVLASLRAVSAVPAPELASMAAHVDEWAGFRSLAAHPPPGLDSWVARHLDRLAAVEAEVSTALEGSALVHGDIRADNVLLSAGVAWLVDWPWACAGVPWWDVVTMAPSVAMQGGPAPADLLRLAGVDGDPAAVTVAVTAITGYFLNQSRLPPPPGIPAVRRFQAAQGVIALGWLRERLGWP
jgi:aminoglycoside phosphotransferase (APT) family kinase protein